ncbi:hypothetical protein M0R45_020535 [Rubus argutus]|uniref:Uncharacterized protein n=1 Tax=Rubus argutus TaxID=59490 RepID=A0AAW1X951_RUBAR
MASLVLVGYPRDTMEGGSLSFAAHLGRGCIVLSKLRVGIKSHLHLGLSLGSESWASLSPTCSFSFNKNFRNKGSEKKVGNNLDWSAHYGSAVIV